jgi:hypothetical protein
MYEVWGSTPHVSTKFLKRLAGRRPTLSGLSQIGFILNWSPRVLAVSVGFIATSLLVACGSPSVPSGAADSIVGIRPVMEVSHASRSHALSGCAPSTSYGAVIVNGVAQSGAPQILQITDTSSSSSSTMWNVAMTIDAGPSSSTFGPEPSGITTVKVYDFAGKLLGTYYPNIAAYPTSTTTTPESTALSPCHLSRATFSYVYNWSTFATPTIPAQSGSESQTATLTYPAQPTTAPSSSPQPTPTPGQCGPMSRATLLIGSGNYGLRTIQPTLDSDVTAKDYADAVTELDSFTTSAADYVQGVSDFDSDAHAADPSYAYPQPDATKAETLYNAVFNDTAFLDGHHNNAARWATAVTDAASMENITSKGVDREAEFTKDCN